MGYAVPGLLVRADGRIAPAAPGMIAELDARAAGGQLRDVRLVSSYDPHTTGKQARDCASCHDVGARARARERASSSWARPARASAPRTPIPRDPRFAIDGWTRLFPAQARAGHARGCARARRRRAAARARASAPACPATPGPSDPIWRDFQAIRRPAGGGRNDAARTRLALGETSLFQITGQDVPLLKQTIQILERDVAQSGVPGCNAALQVIGIIVFLVLARALLQLVPSVPARRARAWRPR